MAFAFAILAFEQYYVNNNLANAQIFYAFFGLPTHLCCVLFIVGAMMIVHLHKERFARI